jgi:AbrB family looped-hinge helix DNA binding protein
MAEVWLRVNENGRVVLPAAFRKALNIRPGDQVLARLEDDEVRITTLKHRIEPAVCKTRKVIGGRVDCRASRGRQA